MVSGSGQRGGSASTPSLTDSSARERTRLWGAPADPEHTPTATRHIGQRAEPPEFLAAARSPRTPTLESAWEPQEQWSRPALVVFHVAAVGLFVVLAAWGFPRALGVDDGWAFGSTVAEGPGDRSVSWTGSIIQDVKVVHATSTTAEVHWTIADGLAGVSSQAQYGLGDVYDGRSAPQQGPGPHAAALTGLLPSSDYSLRIQVQDSSGHIAHSEVLVFSTPPATPFD